MSLNLRDQVAHCKLATHQHVEYQKERVNMLYVGMGRQTCTAGTLGSSMREYVANTVFWSAHWPPIAGSGHLAQAGWMKRCRHYFWHARFGCGPGWLSTQQDKLACGSMSETSTWINRSTCILCPEERGVEQGAPGLLSSPSQLQRSNHQSQQAQCTSGQRTPGPAQVGWCSWWPNRRPCTSHHRGCCCDWTPSEALRCSLGGQ